MSAHFRPDDSAQALVVVPTYDERDSITEVARRLFAAAGDRVDLLIVDDSSPDGTADLVRQLAEGPHDIHLLERPGKMGLGTAYVAGFGWALQRGYRAVVSMDADLSHDPAAVPSLLDALAGAGLAIGSRYVPGGGVSNWGMLRRLLSRAGNVYAKICLGFKVEDSTSGFRAYDADLLRRLDLGTIKAEGYAFQIEMTWRALLAGEKVVEVPITFVERTAGKSKLSRRIVVEALLRVTKWGLSRLRPGATTRPRRIDR